MLKLKKFSLIISLLLFLPLVAFGMEKQLGFKCASSLTEDTCNSKVVVLALNDTQASGDADKFHRPYRPIFFNRGYPFGFYPYGFYPYGFYPYGFGFGFYPYILLDNSGGDGEAESDDGGNWDANKH